MNSLLHQELTYLIRGELFAIRKEYGPGQKEVVYHRLLAEKLSLKGLSVLSEPSIKIHSHDTGKLVGIYKPDILVNELVIIEIKSSRVTPIIDEKQLYYYLRNSIYEVGILVNFSTPTLYIKRIIYTNDRKER